MPSETDLITAQFLYEGQDDYFRGKNPHGWLDLWGGAVERARLMAHYTPVIAPLLARAIEDPPGVLVYDVVAPLGRWIAEQIDTGHTPPSDDAVAEQCLALMGANEYLGVGR